MRVLLVRVLRPNRDAGILARVRAGLPSYDIHRVIRGLDCAL